MLSVSRYDSYFATRSLSRDGSCRDEKSPTKSIFRRRFVRSLYTSCLVNICVSECNYCEMVGTS